MKQDNTHPTQEEIIEWNRAQSRRARRTHKAEQLTLIGWIGIIMTMLFMTCNTATAQTMYEVEYASQADLLLYEVKYANQADIRYYPVQYRSQANERRNHWYWTDYPAQAKYRVYWVRYRSQADRLVYEVQYPTQTR